MPKTSDEAWVELSGARSAKVAAGVGGGSARWVTMTARAVWHRRGAHQPRPALVEQYEHPSPTATGLLAAVVRRFSDLADDMARIDVPPRPPTA